MFPGLILWIVGIPLAIWRPRKLSEGSWKARAYRAVRWAAAWLLAAYLLLVIPDLLTANDPLPTLILAVVSGGALLLWPLATVALALDMRRRWLALPAALVALLFSSGLAWLALVTALVYLNMPELPNWRGVVALLALFAALVAVVSVLEAYALIRRPDPS